MDMSLLYLYCLMVFKVNLDYECVLLVLIQMMLTTFRRFSTNYY